MKRTNREPFKCGDYVIDDRDTYYVLEAEPHKKYGQLLHIECVRSGNTYGGCEARHYRRCKKPKSFKQEVNDLCRKYGAKVVAKFAFQNKEFKAFAKEFVALQRKHGDSIYTGF